MPFGQAVTFTAAKRRTNGAAEGGPRAITIQFEARQLGQVGAGMLVAIAVAIVAPGVTLEGGVSAGGFIQLGLVILAAPPFVAGILALGRPSPTTYWAATFVAGVNAVLLLGGAVLVLNEQDSLLRVGVALLAAGCLASAFLLASDVGRISVLTQRKEAALRDIPKAQPLGPGMNAQGQALAGHKCASCDRPLSPVWVGQCQHCGAKYAEFPPAPRTR